MVFELRLDVGEKLQLMPDRSLDLFAVDSLPV